MRSSNRQLRGCCAAAAVAAGAPGGAAEELFMTAAAVTADAGAAAVVGSRSFSAAAAVAASRGRACRCYFLAYDAELLRPVLRVASHLIEKDKNGREGLSICQQSQMRVVEVY